MSALVGCAGEVGDPSRRSATIPELEGEEEVELPAAGMLTEEDIQEIEAAAARTGRLGTSTGPSGGNRAIGDSDSD